MKTTRRGFLQLGALATVTGAMNARPLLLPGKPGGDPDDNKSPAEPEPDKLGCVAQLDIQDLAELRRLREDLAYYAVENDTMSEGIHHSLFGYSERREEVCRICLGRVPAVGDNIREVLDALPGWQAVALRALDLSIEHWERLATAKPVIGPGKDNPHLFYVQEGPYDKHCGCCQAFSGVGEGWFSGSEIDFSNEAHPTCVVCPIGIANGYCDDTPWEMAKDAWETMYYMDFDKEALAHWRETHARELEPERRPGLKVVFDHPELVDQEELEEYKALMREEVDYLRELRERVYTGEISLALVPLEPEPEPA